MIGVGVVALANERCFFASGVGGPLNAFLMPAGMV